MKSNLNKIKNVFIMIQNFKIILKLLFNILLILILILKSIKYNQLNFENIYHS